ncbi:MAG: YfcE family phosphodiesterase [Candidatus Omnitrophica bacterium]|nr:YfcE family phosphodiesterase [Candidatus Omnitrophota bacterium]
MKAGVVSDSHGYLDNLREAGAILCRQFAVDMLIHLGDDYEDATVLSDLSVPLIRVPGVHSTFYRDRRIEKRPIKKIEGWRFLITHTPHSHANDPPDLIRPETLVQKREIDVVIHGHTHIPQSAQSADGIIWINPGHLKDEDKRNPIPSFAMISAIGQLLEVTIFSLTRGAILIHETYQK